LSRDCG